MSVRATPGLPGIEAAAQDLGSGLLSQDGHVTLLLAGSPGSHPAGPVGLSVVAAFRRWDALYGRPKAVSTGF